MRGVEDRVGAEGTPAMEVGDLLRVDVLVLRMDDLIGEGEESRSRILFSESEFLSLSASDWSVSPPAIAPIVATTVFRGCPIGL